MVAVRWGSGSSMRGAGVVERIEGLTEDMVSCNIISSLYLLGGAETCYEHVSALLRYMGLVGPVVALAGGRPFVYRMTGLSRSFWNRIVVAFPLCSDRFESGWGLVEVEGGVHFHLPV